MAVDYSVRFKEADLQFASALVEEAMIAELQVGLLLRISSVCCNCGRQAACVKYSLFCY